MISAWMLVIAPLAAFVNGASNSELFRTQINVIFPAKAAVVPPLLVLVLNKDD